jgi:formylglycine-generating enzyme required for sulfatase activity
MEFVVIPAGSFLGQKEIIKKNDFGEITDKYRPKFIINEPFYLGKYEVTQEQWVAVMGSGSNPARFKGRTNPVENMTWKDVQEFIKRLNAKEGHNRYRLPTEMEWEYAARAGTDSPTFFGKELEEKIQVLEKKADELRRQAEASFTRIVDKYATRPHTPELEAQMRLEAEADAKELRRQRTELLNQVAPLRQEIDLMLDAYAWYSANSGQTTHPVGQKKPNSYGLYDIYGNVAEFMYAKPITGPDAYAQEITRHYISRGCSWQNSFNDCRSDDRGYRASDAISSANGFRLAINPK